MKTIVRIFSIKVKWCIIFLLFYLSLFLFRGKILSDLLFFFFRTLTVQRISGWIYFRFIFFKYIVKLLWIFLSYCLEFLCLWFHSHILIYFRSHLRTLSSINSFNWILTFLYLILNFNTFFVSLSSLWLPFWTTFFIWFWIVRENYHFGLYFLYCFSFILHFYLLTWVVIVLQ